FQLICMAGLSRMLANSGFTFASVRTCPDLRSTTATSLGVVVVSLTPATNVTFASTEDALNEASIWATSRGAPPWLATTYKFDGILSNKRPQKYTSLPSASHQKSPIDQKPGARLSSLPPSMGRTNNDVYPLG